MWIIKKLSITYNDSFFYSYLYFSSSASKSDNDELSVVDAPEGFLYFSSSASKLSSFNAANSSSRDGVFNSPRPSARASLRAIFLSILSKLILFDLVLTLATISFTVFEASALAYLAAASSLYALVLSNSFCNYNSLPFKASAFSLATVCAWRSEL